MEKGGEIMNEIKVIIDDENKITIDSDGLPLAKVSCILEVARACLMHRVVYGKDEEENSD